MSLSFSITLSLEDFVAANRLYLRSYWIWWGLLKVYVFTALAYFLLILGLLAVDEPMTWPVVAYWLRFSLLFGLGMAVLMPIVTLAIMHLRVKRQFEQLSLGLPTGYEINGDGFRAANELATATLACNRLCDFIQNRRFLLLRRTQAIFFILPKAQLTSAELESLLSLLQEAGVTEGRSSSMIALVRPAA